MRDVMPSLTIFFSLLYSPFDLFVFAFSFPSYKQRGGDGGALPDFILLLYFSCSADHERDWPPIFFALANTIR